MPRLQYQNNFLLYNFDDPIEIIVSITYPYLINNYMYFNYIQNKVILAIIEV